MLFWGIPDLQTKIENASISLRPSAPYFYLQVWWNSPGILVSYHNSLKASVPFTFPTLEMIKCPHMERDTSALLLGIKTQMMIIFLEQVLFPNLLSSAKVWHSEGPNFCLQNKSGRGKAVICGGGKGSKLSLTLAGVGGNEVCSKPSLDPLSPASQLQSHPHLPFQEPSLQSWYAPPISTPACWKSSLSSIPQLTRSILILYFATPKSHGSPMPLPLVSSSAFCHCMSWSSCPKISAAALQAPHAEWSLGCGALWWMYQRWKLWTF